MILPAAEHWSAASLCPRDPKARERYAHAALSQMPRLLGAIDRNPFHETYGCFDRQFWHYRTAGFASEMYQEAVLPLALAYATPLPGNRWHGEARVKELAVAALRFTARSARPDGSCDDYYPYERALGAAVFSLQAATRACQVLGIDAADIMAWLRRRADWIAGHDETGRLANHHALAALGLARVAQITGERRFMRAAQERVRLVLAWQSPEGWFDEYGGADPGYQTVTIDALAKLRKITHDSRLDEPLLRAVEFSRLFLHPDGSYGGEYGSRGTYHFYPHGFELLAGEHAAAADLADGFLAALAAGKQASFDDDRMFAHRLANLIEAYVDWSSVRPEAPDGYTESGSHFLPEAGLLVRRDGEKCTIVSSARGGVFKRFAPRQPPLTDSGLVIETADGRQAVSQVHDRRRDISWQADGVLEVTGRLHWVKHETPTPLKQAVFHVGMCLVGRWCRTLVRRLLQRRLISGRRPSGVLHTRQICFDGSGGCQVTDQIKLLDSSLRVRRMAFSSDLQAAYVAAANVYQESTLQPWVDLSEYIDELNGRRRVSIVRDLH
ncbi:MAG TPA: hypothetical protein VG826_26735 [Pirellulales bacterium]|nr:hypothetical protein [Pirellulales bacterium]